jgi:hypothetical protein
MQSQAEKPAPNIDSPAKHRMNMLLRSLTRAQDIANGSFDREIVAVDVISMQHRNRVVR